MPNWVLLFSFEYSSCMDVGAPYTAITSRLEGEVLAVLVGTHRPMTGRQIGRLVRRGSDRGVRLALARLAEHGLVEVVQARPALLYTLNRDHLAAPVAEALVSLRHELVHRVREVVASWPIAPVHASMFGSAARGDGDTDSDIDLLIIRPDTVDEDDPAWRQQLEDLTERLQRWTGNHTSISDVGEGELPMLIERDAPIVEELERDAVTLGGPDARVLLRAASVRG